MRDERLETETRKRIKNHDYEAVFAHGACFHFALCLHKKFGYKIRGIREGHDGKSLSHVWCQKPGDGKGIDIRGVYSEELLVRLANGGNPALPCDVSVDEVWTTIREKDYPPELESEIAKLADWIVDMHERFAAAKPSKENIEKIYSQFAREMENKCG